MRNCQTQVSRALCALVITLSLAACGGAGSEGETARDTSGDVVRTAGGAAVNSEAFQRWQAALTAFNQREESGWNREACNSVAEQFDAAVEAQAGGRFAEALYMAGLSVARCNDNDRAREFYNRALGVNEKLCKARAALGVMELDAERTQQAARIFERAIRDDPRCTEAYVNLAIIQRGRGGAQAREALNNLRRALAIDSSYLPAFNQMALLYLDQAQSNKEMLNLAGVVCRQAQLIDRDYAPIYNTWGLVYVRQENIIEATQMFQRAIRLDDTMFAAHMNFAQITLSFRGYEDARNAFARAVELRPRNYDAHIGLGASLRGLRQLPRAQAQYERAAELNGNRPEAFFNLGVLYQDYMSGSIEDLNRAKGFFEQFLSKAGSNDGFSEPVDAVRRRCRQQGRRGRRRRGRSDDCRPGRLQNIATAVDALRAAAQMQQEAAQQ